MVAYGASGDRRGVDLSALTEAEIADLELNFPHQANLTDDQYAIWLDGAYFFRHLFDDIANNPIEG